MGVRSIRRWLRRSSIALALGALVALGLFVAGEHYQQRDFLPYFLEHKGRLVSVIETPRDPRPDGLVQHLRLRDDRGLEVEALVKTPRSGPGPHPTLITLGGVRSGQRTLNYLKNTGDFIVLAMDYPFDGARSKMTTGEFLVQLPAMRRAMLDTVPATMLGVDYLYGRDDVDRERIVLVGGSFGALFSPALAASDERISAVAIFFGAGDLGTLVAANLELPAPLRQFAAWFGATVVSPLEPLKYIDRVAPRPVFILGGTEDPRMPEVCGRALQERAREPKTVRWLAVGHVNVRSPEFHEEILELFLAWLIEIDVISPEESRTLLREPG